MVSSAQTILMTGATGFLGSNLLRFLLSKGFEVIVLKRSTSPLTRIESQLPKIKFMYDVDVVGIQHVFERHKIGGVLHCATHYGRGDVPPQELIEANLTLPLSILHWSAQAGVKVFVNTDTILDKRVSAYSLSKKQFLEWLIQYSGKMTCTTVALEHFYGPGDDNTKFVTHLIHCMLKEVGQIELTPGEQKRDFIYIDDIVSAFGLIIESSFDRANGLFSFEVGTGRTISIREFAGLVKELSGNRSTELLFGAMPYRENEVMDSKVNVSKLFELGWTPSVKLEDGLRLTIEHERRSLAI